MKRHLSHACRLFALILVFLMVLAPMMTPAAAVAEAETPASERETGSSSGVLPGDLPEWETEPNPDYVPGEEPFRAMEIPTRREKYVKHFALGGGEYQAVVYGDAVHRLSADGTWRDIDNRLLSDGAGRFATPDGRVRVAGNTGRSDFLLSIEEDGYYIAMTPYDSGAVTAIPGLMGELLDSTAEIVNHPERVTEDTDDLDALMTVNNTTRVTYSSVYRATDLEYILTGDTVKENIIVNAPADTYTYVFRIRLSGLYPVLSETGEIRLLDEGTDEERYVMPAPFMYDADGDYSDDVSYRILETEEAGQYLLAVVADENWFSERDRAFPVTIDPTIQTNVLADTYIDQNNPGKNYNSASRLKLSSDSIVFLSMVTPTLPEGSTFLSAMVRACCYYDDSVTSGKVVIGAYQVTSAWNPSTITWNSANQNANFGISTTRLSSITMIGNRGYYENSPRVGMFPVTDAVRSWLSGTSNCGIALKYDSGTIDSVQIHSRESGNSYGVTFLFTYRQQTLPNGVYRLKNVADYRSLDVKDGGYTDGTALQIWTTYTSLNRNQLYKITYAGAKDEDNLYTIRPMVNNALGLYCNFDSPDHSVKLKTMPEGTAQQILSSGELKYLWAITEENGNYSIGAASTNASNKYVQALTNVGNGANVFCGSSTSETARWIPEAYTEELNGINWRAFASTVSMGDTFTYQATMYSSTNEMVGAVWYSVKNMSGGETTKATIDRTTGKFVPKEVGQVKVYARCPGAKFMYMRTVTIILPLSGYELPYNPDAWNNIPKVHDNSNCYAYILNNQVKLGTNDPWIKQQPGEISGNNVLQELINGARIEHAAIADAQVVGKVFQSIGKTERCPAGTYKVALVVDPGNDFHWYRQNPDGTWSHKPGLTDVVNTDASGELIYDPEIADRDYSPIVDYSVFVGYYAVEPWNNLYVPETSNRYVISLDCVGMVEPHNLANYIPPDLTNYYGIWVFNFLANHTTVSVCETSNKRYVS